MNDPMNGLLSGPLIRLTEAISGFRLPRRSYSTKTRRFSTKTALPCAIVLRGDEHLLLQRLEDMKLERLPIAKPMEPAPERPWKTEMVY